MNRKTYQLSFMILMVVLLMFLAKIYTPEMMGLEDDLYKSSSRGC